MLEFDGSKLKKLRKERQLTQKELGILVGKGSSYIANYENGYAAPPSDTLLSLLAFFKVSPRDMSKTEEAAR